MPDSMEPDWQHVEQEAAHKLPSVERHGLVAGAALLAVSTSDLVSPKLSE